jgi:hypothetical protein
MPKTRPSAGKSRPAKLDKTLYSVSGGAILSADFRSNVRCAIPANAPNRASASAFCRRSF